MIVIIPAYEPDYRLENLVKSLKKEKNLKLIVVNDGSSSDEVFNKIKNDVIILKHDINLGKGIAMKTGLNYVLNNFKDESVIFADADGQHSSDDIIKLSLLDDNFSLIIGTRDFNLKHVPFSSRFGNRLTSLIVYNKTKKYIKDTQSGLRLIPYKYIKDIVNLEGSRYEYEINILLYLKLSVTVSSPNRLLNNESAVRLCVCILHPYYLPLYPPNTIGVPGSIVTLSGVK